MFAQAESGLYCPICMTDGVARVLLKFGSDEVKQQFFPRLTAQNVETLYQGAMFLTEKQGGSDVGANTTKAVKDSSGWKLYGDKWFCSNAGAEMILALARPEGAPEGTRGLGLFLVPKYLENGERNSYTINRLKDKLGVRSMPTGEITLNGAIAYPIGDVERGFHYMAEMINLSRLYNSVASIAIVRRAVYEAVSYAKSRTAFGKQIIDFPLMQHVLADMIVESRAAFHFVFEAIRLLDLIDSGVATPDDEKQLRLMTPLAKYYTAKLAVWAASESMEVLGGNGYIEEFVTARLLRDAQVLPIWEGATNILVLDAIRAMTKEESHKPLLASVERRLESTNQGLAERINNRKHLLNAELERLLREKKVFTGRSITDSLVKVVQASLLAADQHENGQDVTEYFIEKHFYGKVREELARKIVAFESKASF
jgi:alkylation response protein AidB-like acyl-CoA dehydrogenase